jgi:hypothetical protein
MLFVLTVFIAAAQASKTNLCDMIVEDCIKVNGGDSVIDSKAHVKGLRGHWSFDDNLGLDTSGKANHASSAVTAGPGYGGRGTSAWFTGYNYMEIDNDESLNEKTFTVTFWINLHKDSKIAYNTASGKRWCPILQKGEDN